MCGFTGFWEFSVTKDARPLGETVRAMAKLLAHRGPDSCGEWWDDEVKIALGHRRLSIQDLSPEGHQPMISSSGRFIVVYNGEIYNAPALAKELEQQGVRIEGHCDTRVLLEAWQAWGPVKACQRFVGMFAFALWDQQDRTLSLVRDRVGVKPLYWGFQGSTLFFGSTPKSFRLHPHWQGKVDPQALDLFFRLGYVPTPYSIFQGLSKAKQASIITIRQDRSWKSKCFWSLPFPKPSSKTPEVLQEEGTALILEAVRCRLLSDVPVGAFLSGGIDSSLVVASMQSLCAKPIQTFSLGFQNAAYNEAPHAAAVAQHLGTYHHEYIATDRDWETWVPQMSHGYDEPFADSSQLPTMLISHWARQHVTVVLSGDGGDELFSGYTRYHVAQRWWKRLQYFPLWLRLLGGRVLTSLPKSLWQQVHFSQEKRQKIIKMGQSRSLLDCYKGFLTLWDGEDSLIEGAPPFQWPYPEVEYPLDPVLSFQHMDMVGYLMDDILVKVDRASMAFGLEAREPLLDHRLLEWAWNLPISLRIHRGISKWIARKILSSFLPLSLVDRPKQGFGVPLASMLAGCLSPWARDLLSSRPHPLLQETEPLWRHHLQSNPSFLWALLMFQSWWETYGVDQPKLY